jgi:hypothetical protein
VSCPAQPADGRIGGCHARRYTPCHGVPRQVPQGRHAPCHGGVPRAVAPAASCISLPQPPAGAATGCNASQRNSCPRQLQTRLQTRVLPRVGCAPTPLDDLASSCFQTPPGIGFITGTQKPGIQKRCWSCADPWRHRARSGPTRNLVRHIPAAGSAELPHSQGLPAWATRGQRPPANEGHNVTANKRQPTSDGE